MTYEFLFSGETPARMICDTLQGYQKVPSLPLKNVALEINLSD